MSSEYSKAKPRLLQKQDRLCTVNLTLRHFRAAVLAVERQQVYVCSFSYPACKAHAPYCHLWPDRLYYIFPQYLIKNTIFGG